MLDIKLWKKVSDETPGYEGKRRNENIILRNGEYGEGQWTIGWVFGELVLEYEEVCRVYEDGYYRYFQSRPELLEHLCSIASEVYDDDISNIASGQDYNKKGETLTHIQDIAIRRCLVRLGKAFKGSEPVQIRDAKGRGAISKALSPGQVPCHVPHLITTPENLIEIRESQWWLPDSVEDFYQLNKRLFVRKESSK